MSARPAPCAIHGGRLLEPTEDCPLCLRAFEPPPTATVTPRSGPYAGYPLRLPVESGPVQPLEGPPHWFGPLLGWAQCVDHVRALRQWPWRDRIRHRLFVRCPACRLARGEQPSAAERFADLAAAWRAFRRALVDAVAATLDRRGP